MPLTISGFGMTEIGCGVSLSFLDSDVDVQRSEASGWPLAGLSSSASSIPGAGATPPPGEPGEICVRGYDVMQGYYRKPEETAERHRRRRLAAHRRHAAILRADGCLRFLGRYKDMLKVGGENVDPMEIEGFLLEHPRVNHVAVVGLPDARLGEVPSPIVVQSGRDARRPRRCSATAAARSRASRSRATWCSSTPSR